MFYLLPWWSQLYLHKLLTNFTSDTHFLPLTSVDRQLITPLEWYKLSTIHHGPLPEFSIPRSDSPLRLFHKLTTSHLQYPIHEKFQSSWPPIYLPNCTIFSTTWDATLLQNTIISTLRMLLTNFPVFITNSSFYRFSSLNLKLS